jgi:hypothetical protein
MDNNGRPGRTGFGLNLVRRPSEARVAFVSLCRFGTVHCYGW